jgi:IS1 family transposase
MCRCRIGRDFPAEVRNVFGSLRENIVVSRPSPYVNITRDTVNLRTIYPNVPSFHIGLSPYIDAPRRVTFVIRPNVWKLEIIWKRRVSNLSKTHVASHFIRGSFSLIAPPSGYNHVITLRLRRYMAVNESSLSVLGGTQGVLCRVGGFLRCISRFLKFGILLLDFNQGASRNAVLPDNCAARSASDKNAYTSEDNRPYFTRRKWLAFPVLLILGGSGGIFWGLFFSYIHRYNLSWRLALGVSGLLGGLFIFLWGLNIIFAHTFNISPHSDDTVPQKYLLTNSNYWGTVIGIGRADMPNVLSTDKQVAVISALAEGSGIRQIERITGVHRDTIMRLGVRVGKGCANVLDAKMRNLYCNHLQFDEIWGFIGKKERHCTPDDSPEMGDVWTFCAIDQETKIVPSFRVGKRDAATANAFVADVASRLKNRVQISSDALSAYVNAVELAFGAEVDFAQIVKTYVHEDAQNAERKYSAPEFVIEEKKAVAGFPDMRMASTSHIERLNGTTRLHMRRLTRLTYAFSKKRENFEAAVALHFAYYNFVKRHNSLRCTPAMAAGIERNFWTVRDLVEAAA